MEKLLVAVYLDWVNNYLTIKKMAKDYRLTESDLKKILRIGKSISEKGAIKCKR